ncbi:hypothetical protein TCA2_4318 [Paenibacillus sp. TCA20]|uniref:DEAD/DEAH box helicase n=1 Tax=Paenibacillus sp. TCA20 TaxID=1499968 RepID=UPI0004DA377C|nr:DEAD/DEAH box helicase [Paenibacillus sp. TCA20]GAK41826.1 hypothetical protein TCA2_4318 [Paenibacillus sp. TCA20]
MSFWSKLKKRTKEPEYNAITWQLGKVPQGLSIQLFRDGGQTIVSPPLRMSVAEIRQQPNVELLELIESMWYEELLQESDNRYLLPYELLVEAPSEIRETLGVPEPVQLELFLGHEGFVGSPRFQFKLEKHLPAWRHIEKSSRQIGPWIQLPDRSYILMALEQYQLHRLISEETPDVMDKEQVFAYVAKVQSQARQLSIPVDDYLQKQNYKFADGLDLDVSYDGSEIEIIPKYLSSDEVPDKLLDEMAGNNSTYYSDSETGKIFVSTDVVQQAKVVKNRAPIRGQDIPRFAENPEAFLPELGELDLSLFGERVRSLGIRVYKAQPYVHAEEKGRGWFELNAGVSLVDSEGETNSNFSTEQFKDLINNAREAGAEFIELDGNWIKVPHDVEKFEEAVGRFHQALGDKPEVDVTKLPYVLEIFENITQLEYNQPILAAHQEMMDQGILDPAPPTYFNAQLKPFQQDGFVWMKSLHYRKLGGLLADDMGLGKTIQVVSFLSYLHEQNKLTPTLIVVPKSLIDNWVAEVHKFASPLASKIYIHTGVQRLKDPERLQQQPITLTTYQTLVRDQLVFGQVAWQALVCDEAQAIKNPTTAASKVIKAMNVKFRLAMTGTPVENGLSELWSIMDYVQPGLLGSLSEFKKEFMDKLEAEERDRETEQRLLARINMVYKRRTKSEELSGQLPSKSLIELPVSLGTEQKQLYSSIISQVQSKSLSGLQAIQQLRELCSHPALLVPTLKSLPVGAVPKLAQTMKLLREIQSKGEKALIFTELRLMQEIIRDAVREEFQIDPFIINGVTNRRQEVVNQFNEKAGFDVMILSPKAAGTGLTITAANHVIHYTRWWNPAVENQATDRVYRIGQNKPVQVYYPIVTAEQNFLSSGTVEEIVHRILSEKQELASSIIVSSRKLEIENEVLESAFQ